MQALCILEVWALHLLKLASSKMNILDQFLLMCLTAVREAC